MQPFDARWPCPFAPLSTLRLPPHSDRRMTRGEGGRLLLPSAGLPPAVLRQLAWRTPTWSLNRPGRPLSSECFSRCRYLHRPLRLLPAGATVAGRDSHPLRNGALSRRTEFSGLERQPARDRGRTPRTSRSSTTSHGTRRTTGFRGMPRLAGTAAVGLHRRRRGRQIPRVRRFLPDWAVAGAAPRYPRDSTRNDHQWSGRGVSSGGGSPPPPGCRACTAGFCSFRIRAAQT